MRRGTSWRSLFAVVLGLLSGCTEERRAGVALGLATNATPALPSPLNVDAPPAEPLPGDPVRGRALVERLECNRCHDGTGLPEPSRELHCVHCHRDIESGKLVAPAGTLARWRDHVAEVASVPSLVGAGTRFRRTWLTAFLLEPTDLRPRLVPSMPRLSLGTNDARDIAAFFAERDGAVRAVGDEHGNTSAERGRRLAVERGCPNCHAFGGVEGWPATRVGDQRVLRLAPDLRFARERLRPELVVGWLLDPRAQKADTLMPALALGATEASDIARFVLDARLEPLPPRKLPARLPVLDRPVSFEEVNRVVFAVTCRHCHAEPDEVLGDGGPGNDGGFGFAPRRIAFTSHRGILKGGLDEHGQRASLFRPEADGTPRLVAVLLARQAEEAGAPRKGVRGMPLGLPALGPTEIQLVETWIAQGRPL
jgi:cbb3-type cytochrome oxidase cytochrome c subunit